MTIRPDAHKDFGPIAADYAFFERHATEAERDALAYVPHLRRVTPAAAPVRMLDFGCGSGSFTARLLDLAGWPPERLRLTLVEPAESARHEAVALLARYSASPIAASTALPAVAAASQDVVLANHVLYYVPDLQRALAELLGALSRGGVFLCAVAGRRNFLIELWRTGFALLGRDVPYHVAEDVEAAFRALGAEYRKKRVDYELTFRDCEENRLRIIRFLLADHLERMPLAPLLEAFGPYSAAGRVHVRTSVEHLIAPSRVGA